MKIKTPFALNLTLACSAVLGMLPSSAHCQVYSFSAIPTARVQLGVMDRSDFGAGSTRWIGINGLAETVYYDSSSQTIRQVGTISLDAPGDLTLSFNDNQTINGNPQNATVTANFTIPSVVSFDSGIVSLNGEAAQFNPPAIPITGSYTILAGDQTLTGAFGYSLDFPASFTAISDATTGSLVISQSPSFYNFSAPAITGGITAANGMVFNLVGGISDGTYGSSWSLDPVTVQGMTIIFIPEPGSASLFGLGLLVCGLGLFRCRSRLRRVRVDDGRRQNDWRRFHGR